MPTTAPAAAHTAVPAKAFVHEAEREAAAKVSAAKASAAAPAKIVAAPAAKSAAASGGAKAMAAGKSLLAGKTAALGLGLGLGPWGPLLLAAGTIAAGTHLYGRWRRKRQHGASNDEILSALNETSA